MERFHSRWDEPKASGWMVAWFVFVALLALTFAGLVGWGLVEGILWLRRN